MLASVESNTMPNQHGGARVPGPGKKLGPKPKPHKLRIIKIACTQEELQQILSTIKDTRKRALILLEHKGTK